MSEISSAIRYLSNFFHVTPFWIYLVIIGIVVVVFLYLLRRTIIKSFMDAVHEYKHRNFFERFVPLKEKAGKKIYPDFNWINSNVGGHKFKKIALKVKNLYVTSKDSISLDQWSTEFGVRFTHVERGKDVGTYILRRSAFEFLPVIKPRDIQSLQSNKERISIGIQENLHVYRLPLFGGDTGHTRIAAQSGHGKTHLLAWIVHEVTRVHPTVKCLVVTSKGAPIYRKQSSIDLEILNPNFGLKAVRDRLVELLNEADKRLIDLEASKDSINLDQLTLVIIDEALDVLSSRVGKVAGLAEEEEALKQDITRILGLFASKMRSVGCHLIVASQSASNSDYPITLRNNVSNIILGAVDMAFYPVHFEGGSKELFGERLEKGTWLIRSQDDNLKKVRVVCLDDERLTLSEDEKK